MKFAWFGFVAMVASAIAIPLSAKETESEAERILQDDSVHKGDVQMYFRRARKRIRELQYQALQNQKGPLPTKKWRYRRRGTWVPLNARPERKRGKIGALLEIWEFGRVSVGTSGSRVSGGGAGYVEYSTTYGSKSIWAWKRRVWNPERKKYELPRTTATSKHLKAIERRIHKFLPERIRAMETIVNVEKRKYAESQRRTIQSLEASLRLQRNPPRMKLPVVPPPAHGGRRDDAVARRRAESRKRHLIQQQQNIQKRKDELRKLKKEYAKAKSNIAPLNEKFAALLWEAESYASGERELIGYEYLRKF